MGTLQTQKTEHNYYSDLVPGSRAPPISSHNFVIEDTLTDETLTSTKLSYMY